MRKFRTLGFRAVAKIRILMNREENYTWDKIPAQQKRAVGNLIKLGVYILRSANMRGTRV